MDYVNFSKQEILKKETGEQFFWFKHIIANHQAFKPSDHAFKGSLPDLMIIWEDGSKSNGISHLARILHLAGKDFLIIVVLYVKGNNQPKLDASKKAGTSIITQYLSMTGISQWLVSVEKLGMIGISKWAVPLEKFSICITMMTMPYLHMAASKCCQLHQAYL